MAARIENRLRFPARGLRGHAGRLAGAQADVGAPVGDGLGRGRHHAGTTRWRSPVPSPTHGVDLIDVSTGQTVREARPVYGRMFQTPFSDQIRNEAHVATLCVGNITTADQVNTILAAGRADLVALGRTHLVDPSFTLKAAAWYGATSVHCPAPYWPGRDQIFRNSPRDRDDLDALRIRARPKTRAQSRLEAGGEPLAAE